MKNLLVNEHVDTLEKGGVFVVDNTMFKGAPFVGKSKADTHSWNAGGAAIAAFNAFVRDDPRVEQVMLPIRDGITIVRLKDDAPQRRSVAPTAAAVPSAVARGNV